MEKLFCNLLCLFVAIGLLQACSNPLGDTATVNPGLGGVDGIADTDSPGDEEEVVEPAVPVIDQTDDDNTATGFGGGTHLGTSYLNSVLSLDTDSNNASLDESWAPKWENLVGYWKMEESSWNGTAGEVIDSSGRNNNGTRYGSANTINQPKVGSYSGTFNGTSDYIRVADSASLSINGSSMAMCAWFNFPSIPESETERVILRKDNHYQLGFFGSKIRNIIKTTSSGTNGWIDTNDISFSPQINTWGHLCVTFGSSKMISYLNGIQIGPARTVFGSVKDNSNSLGIGAEGGGDLPFVGKIDEVAIWNRDLSADEIALIYSRQSAKFSGQMKSRIIDSKSIGSTWTDLSWITSLPFGKELTGKSGSESSTKYSSLVGSSGSTSDNNLMSGIVGLWHFNESIWNGTVDEVKDFSGNDYHGVRVGNTTLGVGRFSKGASFDGVNDYLDFGDFPKSSSYTVSAWVNTMNVGGRIAVLRRATGDSTETNFICKIDSSGMASLVHVSATDVVETTTGTSLVNTNKWKHIICSYDGTYQYVYVDGILENKLAKTSPDITTTQSLWIGSDPWDGTGDFSGLIDEVAIWNRSLSAAEILQLYRRGANRVKYQVRTCSNLDCSDQDAIRGGGWKGPGGNYLTYFSELQNNTSVSGSCAAPLACYSSELSTDGDINTSSPTISFSSFGSDGLLGMDNNQYFQYQVILESDDENMSCSGGTKTCLPEIKSVNIGPSHED